MIHKHLVQATGLKDRKVRQKNLLVTRETKMPAVLLESGYLSNVYDESVLFDPIAQDRIAAGIVAGIKEYFGL
ncbi:Sporulation-specific N-acetylmuramoyl-L-alanine amidase [compost metagenome]